MRFVHALCAWPPAQGPTAGHGQTGAGSKSGWECLGAHTAIWVCMWVCVCWGWGAITLSAGLSSAAASFQSETEWCNSAQGLGCMFAPQKGKFYPVLIFFFFFFQATVHDMWRRIVFLLFACREIKVSYKLTSFKQAISSKRIIKIPLTCIWPLRWNVAVAAQASADQGAPTLGRAGDW